MLEVVAPAPNNGIALTPNFVPLAGVERVALVEGGLAHDQAVACEDAPAAVGVKDGLDERHARRAELPQRAVRAGRHGQRHHRGSSAGLCASPCAAGW